MLLTIDVGNTQTTLCLFDKTHSIAKQWRMATDTTDTTDQLHERLFGYFLMNNFSLEIVTKAAIASVVPILAQRWEDCINELYGFKPYVVDATKDCGMEIDMPYPTQVGADRIANAIAAKSIYGAPCIVVDFGTATNIDVVDAKGAFCGGAIMPGFMLSAQSLFARAAKLASVPLVAPEKALGRTTEQALQSGMVIGAAAQIEGLVARIRKELGSDNIPVIATGGAASIVMEATDIFDYHNPDLTLLGVKKIYELNAQK